MTVRVPALRVGERQPAHEPRQVAVAVGPDQEVEVVGHQAIAEQAHPMQSHRFGQDAFEGQVVAIIVEDGEPGIGAVQGVVDQSAFCGAGWSSHASRLLEVLDQRQ
jgi:hypothetical protein